MKDLMLFFFEERIADGELDDDHTDDFYFLNSLNEDDDCVDFDEGYTANMPCDTYGPAACGPHCANYAKCVGWEK